MKRLIALITTMFVICTLSQGQAVTRLLYFSLKHEAGSQESNLFFENINILKKIPVVKGFELSKVRSKKLEFDYCLRLVFDDQAGADAYSNHQIHNQYVKDEWIPNVAQGLLVDHIEFYDNSKG